jgi:glycosyltransferase involved in cell wall biosynthesis
MRPLLVDLGREYRGGQDQALLLLKGLLARGHAPALLALHDSILARRAREAGVEVYPVIGRWRRLAAARIIRELLAGRNVDVVHANEPHALTSVWAAGARRAVPLVVSRRIARPILQNQISRARYRAAARIVGVSEFVARSVIESGFPEDRVSVIYDGVPIPPETTQTKRVECRRKVGIEAGARCIANVAAFVPEKGHALLLRAFAVLRAQFPDARLLLRGAGPELKKLQALTHTLNVQSAVTFLSPEFEIETILAAADAFAFPSSEEPLGSALLAAMAQGLPCVAFARGGVPEIIDDGKNGLFAREQNSEAFASTLTLLLAQREEKSRLGLEARKTIADRFSADRMVEQTLHLYRELVTGSI